MSPLATIVVLTCIGVGGAAAAAAGWLQPSPSLHRTLRHVERAPRPDRGSSASAGTSRRLARPVADALRARPRLLPSAAELRVLGRSVEQHAMHLVIAATAGLTMPPLVVAVLQTVGLVSLDRFVPLLAALVSAVAAPMLVHAAAVERATTIRSDLRYQVSAFLDVVTMLLAGNTGYEGALEQAAAAGDGRLFAELRRRMRESGARGASLTDALERTGRELGLDELEQVAATAALSAAEGAPVARTLSAKCATLRLALATEQESEARLRTSRLTTPIVGMALIFMGLVMYPALSFS